MENKIKRFKTIEWYLFILCVLLEGGCVALLIIVHESICVQAFEILIPVMFSLQSNLMLGFGDIVYVFMMICMKNLGREPLTIMYNLVTGLINIGAGTYLLVTMTFCGNRAQYLILISGCCGFISGLIHVVNGCLLHWLLPREEL